MKTKTAKIDCWNPKNETVVGKSGLRYLDTTSVITHETEIKYTDDIQLFEDFYKMNNRLRYCNGSYFTFRDKKITEKYKEWLESDDYKKKAFNLYYGNGTVD